MHAPFLFKPGALVVPGLWYTDTKTVKKCIRGGNPLEFAYPYFADEGGRK